MSLGPAGKRGSSADFCGILWTDAAVWKWCKILELRIMRNSALSLCRVISSTKKADGTTNTVDTDGATNILDAS